MHHQKRVNDAVHWYMGDLGARVVAESGCACDRFHLGKLILQGLKDAPNFILQIDGATGKSETNASVLERSVKCAISMQNFGLRKGDVIALLAPNHLDTAIVYYAALYLGITFAAIDRNATVDELNKIFECDKPKIIFCQASKVVDIQRALSKLETEIVTFDESKDELKNYNNFDEFLNKKGIDTLVEQFKPSNFDPESTIASIIGTSGTTGSPKKAIITHKSFAVTGPHLWSRFTTFPTPTRMALIPAPIQWMSSMVIFNLSPILRFTRLQSTEPSTTQHVYHLINTYKPTFLATSTTMMANLIKPAVRHKCDLSSFELILFGGSPVSENLMEEVKQVMPKAEIFEAYGFTEASTYFVFQVGSSPPGSCGQPTGYLQYRLINVETQEDITSYNKAGELWVKGPGVCKGYYNNPEATKEALTEDGWFKTGDMFYRDERWNFYFVDRIKLLIRYKDYLISPAEVEKIIRQHPGVFDVAVTEIPDYDCTSLPVACVVRRPGSNVTSQEIKDFVKEKVDDDWKLMTGGVVFFKELPMTPTTKIDRRKLKEIVLKETRE